jgi:SAM-dependent methyltransferase
MKHFLAQLPFLVGAATHLWRAKGPRSPRAFDDSASYWERRYSDGGSSGAGSYGRLAQFKAEVLNRFVAEHGVQSVIELGCGDGNQLALARYPEYLGIDISPTAIARCRRRFGSDPHKAFRSLGEYCGEQSDLALSLDVLYHLVEDEVFERHLRTLFGASRRYAIVYSSDFDDELRCDGVHVRHRRFTTWIRDRLPEWRLSERLANRHPFGGDHRTGSRAEFFFYERSLRAPSSPSSATSDGSHAPGSAGTTGAAGGSVNSDMKAHASEARS